MYMRTPYNLLKTICKRVVIAKKNMTAYGMTEILLKETFEDSREIIRSRKSNTERQYYGQKKQGVIVWYI